VHNAFDLSIRVNPPKPELSSKLTIVRFDPDKEKIISEKSVYKDGWLSAQPQYLGYFAVMIDTVKPSITSIDFTPNLKNRTQFSMSISDGLSGVDQIIPMIDDHWALMEYDAKNSRLTYYFDPQYITHGKHQFTLKVIDASGNEKVYNGSFDW